MGRQDDPFPTREEEEALLARIAEGDDAAFAELVGRNLRLARWAAMRFASAGNPMTRPEREAAAKMGLVKAARAHRRGPTRFSTTAAVWMRKFIAIDRERCRPTPGCGAAIDYIRDPRDRVAEAIDRMSAAGEAEAAMAALGDQEREIVSLRFGIGGGEELNGVAIAERLGISHQRVYRVLANAMAKMAKQAERGDR